MIEKFNHTIIAWQVDEGEKDPSGVIIQIDNGDTQYLTVEEYKTFLEKDKTWWNKQYLDLENLYYLTEHHHEDGMLSEMFFNTEEEMEQYIADKKIEI